MATGDQVTGAVAPILNDVDTTVVSSLTDPGPFGELGLAVMLLVLVIIAHGWCVGNVSRFFGSRFSRFTLDTPQWRVSLLMTATIALLALTHLAQTLIWAAPIWSIGIIPDAGNAYFFVLGSYTTLGSEGVTIPAAWQLIGPVIAISGFFTFSWTGSVLVYVMTEIGRRHQQTVTRTPQSGPDASAGGNAAP
jgi:hypothetical protein